MKLYKVIWFRFNLDYGLMITSTFDYWVDTNRVNCLWEFKLIAFSIRELLSTLVEYRCLSRSN